MEHGWIDSFWSSAYAPHGYCLLWRRDLILTHLVSYVLIALAYFSIPFALVRLVRRRPDVQFGGMFWLFALFIFACGTTHVMAAWNLWHGNYGLEGVVKLVTAAASVPTAVLLWKLLPQAMSIPSAAQLASANERLSAMVMERDQAVERLNREIGEREKAEQALVQMQKIDAIGQLTGGIAHDFNNLLQAIGGNLELIAGSPDKAESVSRWAGNARKAVERGGRLASQLLVFARVQQLERTSVAVNEVIGGMEELLRRSVGPQVRVSLDLTDRLAMVHSEPTQLEMAILNLAINARDAMDGQGDMSIITAEVSGDELPPSLRGGRYVRVSVVDTGRGMTPEVATRAIDPFFTTKEVGKGTGLGLSMAYGFARQSGGVLEIRSEEGVGTRIDIYLPAIEGQAATDAGEADGAGQGPGPLEKAGPRNGLVTLVDDDEGVRTLICDMLRSSGYQVESFASPEEALAKADWIGSRIVILDYIMPGMTGAELAEQIRVEHPNQPIIFVTGFAGSASLDTLKSSTSSVLRKPFTLQDLLGAIDAFTSGEE